MPQTLFKSFWRRWLLWLLFLSPLVATWVASEYVTKYVKPSLVSIVLPFVGYSAIGTVIGVFVGPWLKDRWGTRDKCEARSDSRRFVLVLRPFSSPLVDLPNSGPHYRGKIVAEFCSAMIKKSDFAVVCIGQGERVSHDVTPSEFIRVEPPADRWMETFAALGLGCAAIIVIPEATDGCLRELRTISRIPEGLSKTLVWMPRARGRRQVVAKQWEAVRCNLTQFGFKLPPYDARGQLYRPNADFSVDEAMPFVRRIEEAAVNEISQITSRDSRGLDEALDWLREKGIRW
jgi:hypothetical protein